MSYGGLVAGAGFEPATFGLWVRCAGLCAIPLRAGGRGLPRTHSPADARPPAVFTRGRIPHTVLMMIRCWSECQAACHRIDGVRRHWPLIPRSTGPVAPTSFGASRPRLPSVGWCRSGRGGSSRCPDRSSTRPRAQRTPVRLAVDVTTLRLVQERGITGGALPYEAVLDGIHRRFPTAVSPDQRELAPVAIRVPRAEPAHDVFAAGGAHPAARWRRRRSHQCSRRQSDSRSVR